MLSAILLFPNTSNSIPFLSRKYKNKNVICITHAGVIKVFLHQIFSISKNRYNAFKINPGAILEFTNEEDYNEIQLTGLYKCENI